MLPGLKLNIALAEILRVIRGLSVHATQAYGDSSMELRFLTSNPDGQIVRFASGFETDAYHFRGRSTDNGRRRNLSQDA
jgi:hypothetical protein